MPPIPLCPKKYGEEHPITLTLLNNLAYTYGKLGDIKRALDIYKKIYIIFNVIYNSKAEGRL